MLFYLMICLFNKICEGKEMVKNNHIFCRLFQILDKQRFYFQLLYQRIMYRRYDIESDQLKCSFCTNYFKCSLHFANIQRYSLKACKKCLEAFTYTILHPDTYQIFKVFLVDTGITIPMDTSKLPQMLVDQSALTIEINRLKEELGSKIALYFQEKISLLLQESGLVKKNMEKCLDGMINQLKESENGSQLGNQQKIQQLKKRIERIKRQQLQDILESKGKLLEERHTTLKQLKLSNSIRYVSQSIENKENLQVANRFKVGNMIKSRIFKESYAAVSALSKSKSKGIANSKLSNQSSAKSIRFYTQESDKESISLSISCEQKEKLEIAKILDQKPTFASYMSQNVVKSTSTLIKSQSSRNLTESILQYKKKTSMNKELIELIGVDISKINFSCYLKTLKGTNSVKTIRMIRCGMSDADFDHLLNFLSENEDVETLIVTNNRLTQLSLEAITTFKSRHPNCRLKNIYLGNNHINSLKASSFIRNEEMSKLLICI